MRIGVASSMSRAPVLKPQAEAPVSVRRDIQGLRALAVVVVVLNHMLGWPSGGFAGVDIFFVISGFLITGLLLREFEKTGHISFLGFYKRRVKRIVPAATLTLVAVVGLSFLVLTRQRAIATAWDALFAFVFVANWDFAIRGVDYFQQGGAVSPIQHFWSLSVEEQFYLVWPWLLLGLLILFGRFSAMSLAKMRVIAGTTIGAITLASFGYALMVSSASPTVAYFSSLGRVWELGVGAMIAIAAPALSRQRAALRTVLAYLGLLGMAGSCFFINATTQWPAPWALLPTASAGLALISGIGGEARGVAPLTNRVSVYVGDISYSLYLWHFPVVIFGQALFPGGGLSVYVGMVVVAFGISVAAFHVIEKPIWKSPLWAGHQTRRGAWRSWIVEYGPQMRLGGLAGLSVATAVLCALLIVRMAPLDDAQAIAAPTSQVMTATAPATASGTVASDSAAAEIDAEVVDALRATSWPAVLTPSIDEIGPMSKAGQWVRDGCLGLELGSESDPIQNAKRCVFGDAHGTKTLVVWGDSIAISWVPGLVQGLSNDGWKILVFTEAMCPAAKVSVKSAQADGPLPHCDEFRDWVVGELKRLSPDFVLISQSGYGIDHPLSGARGQQAETDFANGLNATLDAIKGSAKRVALVDSPPATVSIEECYSAGGRPSDCTRDSGDSHRRMTSYLANLVEVRADSSTRFVGVDRLFCAQARCPAAIGGIIVRADGFHPTDAYSRHVGKALAELLGIDG